MRANLVTKPPQKFSPGVGKREKGTTFTMQNVSACVRSSAHSYVVERRKKGGTCGSRAGVVVRARKGLLAEKFEKEEEKDTNGEAVGEDDASGDAVRLCACNSNETYENCCQRVHENGITRETTPEMIVRARFTSYKENKPEFIVESTHEDSPDFTKRDETDAENARRTLESDAKATAKKIRFLSLKIMKKGSNGENESGGEEAFVSYECAFDAGEKRAKKSRAKAKTLAERARYRKDKDGKWKYVDALQLNDNVLSADGFDDGGHNRGKSNWGNGNLGKIF